jgi:hypothetical protein
VDVEDVGREGVTRGDFAEYEADLTIALRML